jgi:hypothetical protein
MNIAGAFMLCATALTPASANGIQCNHPSAAGISQFSACFSKQPTNKKQTKSKQINNKQKRSSSIVRPRPSGVSQSRLESA